MNTKINSFITSFNDSKFSKEFVNQYQENQEFQILVGQIFSQKLKLEKSVKIKSLFWKYWKSYSLMQRDQDSNLICQQDIKGFRYFLFFENNQLFVKLKKCPHQQKMMLLQTNYWIADFPHSWLRDDLKKETLYLEDKDRNSLMKYFSNFLRFTSNGQTKSLLLTGSLNTGKTFLTVVFTNGFILKKNKKVAFTNAVNLYLKFITQKNTSSFREDFKKFYNQLQKVELLIIDDLGNEKNDKYCFFRDDFLLPLLQKRYNFNLLTVLISNFSYADLEKNYLRSLEKIEKLKNANFFNLIQKNSKILSLNKVMDKKMIKL